MITLNNIKVLGVEHPNFFERENKFGCVDLVLTIDYEVEATKEDLKEYDLDIQNLSEQGLKEEFASYLMVNVDAEDYKNLDDLDYKNLDYIVLSDLSPEIEESSPELSEEEQIKAFNLIKKYLKSESFKKELNELFN